MNPHAALTFVPIHDAASCDTARALIQEYAQDALAEHYPLFAEDMEDEMVRLPAPYVAPKGLFLIAYLDSDPCGTIAVRPLAQEGTGEVMRMYVRPEYRGKGIAKQLMQTIMQRATAMHYHTLYLTSLHKFVPAHKLYEQLGFVYVPPYVDTMPAHFTSQAHCMRVHLG